MSSLEFTQDLAQQFYDSTEPFPVDFDLAWVWIGYTRKDSAVKSFESWFTEGIDYIKEEVSTSGRPETKFMISVNCFKEWGMVSRTEKGKTVRSYFIRCEQIAKEVAAEQIEQLRQETFSKVKTFHQTKEEEIPPEICAARNYVYRVLRNAKVVNRTLYKDHEDEPNNEIEIAKMMMSYIINRA